MITFARRVALAISCLALCGTLAHAGNIVLAPGSNEQGESGPSGIGAAGSLTFNSATGELQGFANGVAGFNSTGGTAFGNTRCVPVTVDIKVKLERSVSGVKQRTDLYLTRGAGFFSAALPTPPAGVDATARLTSGAGASQVIVHFWAHPPTAAFPGGKGFLAGDTITITITATDSCGNTITKTISYTFTC